MKGPHLSLTSSCRSDRYHIISYNFLSQKMVQFGISKEQLARIVSACQERTYADQIDILLEKGQTTDWLVAAVVSDQRKGISSHQPDIDKRKEAFGNNQKYVKEPPGFFQLFCSALEDFTLRILIVASILSIVIEVSTASPDHRSTAWIEGVAVMAAVMICATVSAVNDYQKQRQFLKLNSVADQRKKVSLKRNGVSMEIHQDLVLVGDIISIAEGMEIPADGILIDSNEITTDESAMTGETDPIHKNVLKQCIKKKDEIQKSGEKNLSDKHEVPSPIMMSGTRVLTGQGKMMALVVGDLSCLGKIRALLSQEESEATPLQMKLENVAEDIGKFGLYSAIGIVVILLIRFAIQKGISKHWDTSTDLKEILGYFILGITVVVVAIPEGLPLAVTLSLAFSVKKMLMDNNLVRKLQACETMGGANNICSDKTGTLTMNKMTLTQIWNGTTKIIDTHKQSHSFNELTPNEKFQQLFKIATCVNGTAILRPEQKGSSTEVAILKYLEKLGINYETIRDNNQPKMKYPFSSARKRMSVLIDFAGESHIFVKGASQMVLSTCSQWYNMETNQISAITEEVRQKMNAAITKMAESSLRTLCVAYKKLTPTDDLSIKDQKGVFAIQKSGLTTIAILGVQDIPRKEVPDAIRKCHKAGIIVRMVTGDNIITAKAIAKDVGIIGSDTDALVMEGIDFHKLVGGVVCKKCRTVICDCAKDSKQAEQLGKDIKVDTIANAEEFDKIKDRLLVLARSRPEDKYALVTGLRERGEVVAVTGDGTNDAPALKKADVGFAMGISGTEVARQSAAIILLDDNFNSIVKAVLWGRNIYDSIRKFIQFQLCVNIVAVAITLIGAAIIKQQVLKPIQMLWINLIMDTLASLALATEPPNEELLERKPHSRDEYIISKTMFKHIIGQSIYQLIVMIILIFWGELIIPQSVDQYDSTVFAGHPQYKWLNGVVGGTVRSGRMHFVSGGEDYFPVFNSFNIYSRQFTFIFNAFVMMQVFNFVNCRKLHEEFNIFVGILNNGIFIGIVITIFILQLILITFGGIAFGVYANFGLTPKQWGICIAIGAIGMVVNVFLKLLPFGKDSDGQIKATQSGTRRISIKQKSILNVKRIDQRVERNLAKNNLFN